MSELFGSHSGWISLRSGTTAIISPLSGKLSRLHNHQTKPRFSILKIWKYIFLFKALEFLIQINVVKLLKKTNLTFSFDVKFLPVMSMQAVSPPPFTCSCSMIGTGVGKSAVGPIASKNVYFAWSAEIIVQAHPSEDRNLHFCFYQKKNYKSVDLPKFEFCRAKNFHLLMNRRIREYF